MPAVVIYKLAHIDNVFGTSHEGCGDEIDITYDGENNIIIIKEIPLEPSEKELAEQAAKIRDIIKNGSV